jgi:hypothetical protein
VFASDACTHDELLEQDEELELLLEELLDEEEELLWLEELDETCRANNMSKI